ncbi:hypothetical protein SAV14893_079250 [Streptomyces avermitilis]|uniref:Uncharacterized protein n=1 Tax=Streptomyces avermitilis TaxID=33903 RepID=A0A4D4MGG4_STRAX|nr:hypothetical protein SAV14893_079250 [Streptomyces avermitilis]GDY71090.1 hypothetical protein SAV31267_005750 [Streptomyces avermitilis]
MWQPDGSGLTAEERKRREEVRMRAAVLFEERGKVPCIARELRVSEKSVTGRPLPCRPCTEVPMRRPSTSSRVGPRLHGREAGAAVSRGFGGAGRRDGKAARGDRRQVQRPGCLKWA